MKRLTDLVEKNQTDGVIKKSPHRKKASPDLIVAFIRFACGYKKESDSAETSRLRIQNDNIAANPCLPSTAIGPEATVKNLLREMVKIKRKHHQEMIQMNQTMLNMKMSLEQDKRRIIADFWKQADIEKQKAIAQIKKKQWCGVCGKEAIFYCCWNKGN